MSLFRRFPIRDILLLQVKNIMSLWNLSKIIILHPLNTRTTLLLLCSMLNQTQFCVIYVLSIWNYNKICWCTTLLNQKVNQKIIKSVSAHSFFAKNEKRIFNQLEQGFVVVFTQTIFLFCANFILLPTASAQTFGTR